MSDKSLARRTDARVVFDGTDISKDMRPYLLGIVYTDNEEDETDDLQITLADRDGIWLTEWLNTAVYAAAGLKSAESNYAVSAAAGAYVRSGPGEGYAKLASLSYGTPVTVLSFEGDWARVRRSGGDGYVAAGCIERTDVSGGALAVGDEVTVTGRPQYTSYGEGTPGAYVTNYSGKVTYLNRGAPYPICVGYLGWFSEAEVRRVGATADVGRVGTACKGMRIQAAFLRQNWNGDGKDEALECGQFELDAVQASGPPSRITIKGTALPYDSTIRQTEKSRSWENYTLQGILTEIARKNGMAYMFSGANNPTYSRVEQYKTSDIAFLKKLCGDAGCSLKVSNNILIVFDQAAYERKSAVYTIDRKALRDKKYTLKTGKDDTYTSCEVRWVTPSGACIVGAAYIEDYKDDSEKNQCLRVTQKVESLAEAQRLAESLLRLHNKYELTASFTLPGEPKLLAGCAVELKNWGPWDGKYIIKKARHQLDQSGYTTQVELRKVIS